MTRIAQLLRGECDTDRAPRQRHCLESQQPPAPAPPPPLPLNGPIVKVAQGQAQGSSVDGVAVFRGLPFAAPPVGDLRWRAPRPPAKWSGVRAANVFGKNCREAEDCLYLNIFRPDGTALQRSFP